MTFFVNSFILKPPFNSNVFLPLAISPSPCVNANHEIFQSYRDTTPMYNKMPDSVCRSFPNIVKVKINRLHHVTHGQFPVYVACLILLDRKSTRLNSSHVAISYAVFCLKKKKNETRRQHCPQ